MGSQEEGGPTSLSTFACSWLSTRLVRDRRGTTALRCAESLDLHVLPSPGHVFLDKLTLRAIELAFAEWAGELRARRSDAFVIAICDKWEKPANAKLGL
jgi:hypothetical protein